MLYAVAIEALKLLMIWPYPEEVEVLVEKLAGRVTPFA